jgi:L1 cell adhesion molecule like protein
MSISDEEPALGIDLGTTYSCVAVWKNGKVEVIPNESGNRITPSVVCFTNKERLIGDAAKNQIVKNYKNTVYDAKRLIGRFYNDKEVQQDMKLWPFKVTEDPQTKKPRIQVEYKGKTESFLPEEISAFVLSKMKQIAKDFLGKEITEAIVTVPAYFNDLQRKATQAAGKIAGLNVLRTINEPTAAAIAYGLNGDNVKEKNVLIFDLGGGTFDVTILSIDGNLLEVRASKGDMHLGGQDFDNEIVNFCINEFKEQSGIDINDNIKAKCKLKVESEKAKKNLSSAKEISIDIDTLAEGEDFNITISRPEFEDMCKTHFEKLIPIVEDTLKDANLTKERIDDIVLVGGSTRIPKIQEIIKNYFNKEPIKNINADEAVAIGAAIQGAIVNNVEDEGLERLILLDVTPLSLGLELSSGKMDVIIKRNTTIPCEKTEKYMTVKDNQRKITVKVYQGERILAKENKFLGKCEITNIPPKPKGKVHVDVTFSLDINGSLAVNATETSGGQTSDLIIKMDNALSEDVIEELVQRAKEMEKDDLLVIETTKVKTELLNFCMELKQTGNESQKKKADEIIKWVRKNQEESKEIYENKLNEIKNAK